MFETECDPYITIAAAQIVVVYLAAFENDILFICRSNVEAQPTEKRVAVFGSGLAPK